GVGGEPAGGGDVVVGRVGDEIGEADGVEEGDADAGGVGAAGERDDGNAHVEGFAGGGGAVVGKGVERDVDAAVEGKVAAAVGDGRENFDASGVGAGGGEAGADRVAERGVAEVEGLEEEACRGHL